MENRLKELIRQVKSADIARKEISNLKLLLELTEKDVAELGSQLSKKMKQIKNLEKLSFVSIYQNLIKNKTNSLEIAKEHYLNLSLEYNEKIKEAELIKYQLEVLSNKWTSESEMKKEIRFLIAQSLDQYRQEFQYHDLSNVVERIELRLKIEKEIEEAIKAGVALNRYFNTTINFMKSWARMEYKVMERDIETIRNVDLRKMDNFMMKILKIKHLMLKFKSEINDVLSQVATKNDDAFYFVETFINRHRRELAKDIIVKRGFVKCYLHLKDQKARIQEFNRILRKDLKKIRNEIVSLEEKENELINSFKSS